MAPGSTITLQQDPANTAAFYDIDCIDLETPPAALTQPANSISIMIYGAVPNNPSYDSTTAIQNCINAAQSQGKTVWVPVGTFYMNTITGLHVNGVTVQGAGPWYSTIYRNSPFNPPYAPFDSTFVLTGGTVKNLRLDFNAVSRDSASGGATGGIGATGSNWLVDNVWFQHSTAAVWASGANGTVQNCRISGGWADGVNINNLSGTGNNLTIKNNFCRGNDDDGFAIYCAVDGSHAQMQNPTIINNTAIASWGGQEIAIYGGQNIVVENNLLCDSARLTGLGVGFFAMNASIQGALVQNNVLLRCGGNGYSEQQPAMNIGTNLPSWYTGEGLPVESVSNAVVVGNIISNPVFGGVSIHTSSGITLENNVISSNSLAGFVIDSTGVGNATLNNNTVANPFAGYPVLIDDALNYQVSTANGPTNSPVAAASCNLMSSVQTENCGEGGLDVGFISNGSYTEYNSMNLNGVTSIAVRVASPGGANPIQICLDSPTGTVIGTCPVPATGGWQTWTTVTANISGANGFHNVYLVYSSGMNIEWFAFQKIGNTIEAASYNNVSGVQTENCAEGGLDVGYISNGSYTEYNNVNLNGISVFQARVASPSGGGPINIYLDGPSGTLVGTCAVPATGGWQTWSTVSCTLNNVSGYHDLYLVYGGGMNIEWFALQGAVNGTAADSYNSQSSTGLEGCSEGGQDVYFNGPNPYTAYNNVNLNGVTSFQARVASPAAGNTITIHLDSATGTVIGTAITTNTGGYQTWGTVTCSVSGASGFHNVYLTYNGSFNIESFAFKTGTGITEAASYNSLSGTNLFLESNVEGAVAGGVGSGQDLADLQPGNYVIYNDVNITDMTTFQARVASNNSGGTLAVHLESATGPLIGTCSFGATGGWQTWITQSCGLSLNGATGYHNICLVAGGSGFNLEWFGLQGAVSAIAASSYNSLSGVAFPENCVEGGQDLANMNSGACAVYNNINLTGVTIFTARLATNNNPGGTLAIHLDSPTGTLIGTCSAPYTGGWQTWTTQNCSLTGASGIHNIYLVGQGGFNFEWFQFQ